MYVAVISTTLVALLSISVHTAPVDNEAQHNKPLVRNKRAEQVVYGNHQNHDQRVKKSNLPVAADDVLIEKKADPNVQQVSQKEEIPEVINNGELSSSKSEVPADTSADKTEDEEHEEKILMPNGEVDKVTDTKVEHTKDGGIKEVQTTEILESAESDEDFSGEPDQADAPLAKKWNDLDLDDYYYYDDNYYPYPGMFRKKRSSDSMDQRSKRSPESRMMTAENMMTMDKPDPSTRVKRDLATDNIRYWLENGGRFEDYPDYGNEYDDADDGRLRELLAQYALPYGIPEDQELDYPLETEQEAEEEREIEDTKDRLALLKYLMEEAPSEEEGPQGAYPDLRDIPYEGVYPEEVSESWDETMPEEDDDEVTYEPIVYNGVAGIFIPLRRDPQPRKRQYMSMVPGVKKRGFYPYNMEPEGGKWGAFVPQEDKRTAESYERLYEMAQALARNRDADMDWDK